MKTTRIIVAAILAALCVSSRGEESADLAATITRLEKAIADLTNRVAALEGKSTPPPAKEEPAPPPGVEEEAAKQMFAEMIRRQSGGAIDLVALSKLDGLLSTESGVECYSLTFEGALRSNFAGVWSFMPALEDELKFNCVPLPRNTRNQDVPFFFMMNPGTRMEPGRRFLLAGRLLFERAERGWRLARAIETRVEPVR